MSDSVELIEKITRQNRDIVIFGTGEYGRTWAYDILKAAGCNIIAYYDNYAEVGTVIRDGIYVHDISELEQFVKDNQSSELTVCVALNHKIQPIICKQMKEMGFGGELIQMDELFFSDFCNVLDSSEKNMQEKYECIYDDRQYLKTRFSNYIGYIPDFENPKTYNEKLQWIKLNDRKEKYVKLVDKCAVKEYVAGIIGDEYVIKTLGVWKDVDLIDINKLPQKFVIKCTHDSGSVVVVRDKDECDWSLIKSKLSLALRLNWYWFEREWPYKYVESQIIAEEYIGGIDNTIRDYKFFCYNGNVEYLYVSEGLEDHKTAKISFFDLNGKQLSFWRRDFEPFIGDIELPDRFDDMRKLAGILAKDINCPFVRVDFYSVNGRIYFSEITFFPNAGMIPFEPIEADRKLGEGIVL